MLTAPGTWPLRYSAADRTSSIAGARRSTMASASAPGSMCRGWITVTQSHYLLSPYLLSPDLLISYLLSPDLAGLQFAGADHLCPAGYGGQEGTRPTSEGPAYKP